MKKEKKNLYLIISRNKADIMRFIKNWLWVNWREIQTQRLCVVEEKAERQ